MAWTIAKDSGAVSFTHWLDDAEGDILAHMGTPEGALPVTDGHAIPEGAEPSRFEIFPGQSKFLYDDLFFHLPMMILVIGADGTIINSNKSALETLGYSERIGVFQDHVYPPTTFGLESVAVRTDYRALQKAFSESGDGNFVWLPPLPVDRRRSTWRCSKAPRSRTWWTRATTSWCWTVR